MASQIAYQIYTKGTYLPEDIKVLETKESIICLVNTHSPVQYLLWDFILGNKNNKFLIWSYDFLYVDEYNEKNKNRGMVRHDSEEAAIDFIEKTSFLKNYYDKSCAYSNIEIHKFKPCFNNTQCINLTI